MEKVLVEVKKVDGMGAELHSMEVDKPNGCPGLGGWKQNDAGVWWTRVKGEKAQWFRRGEFPMMVLEGDTLERVE